MLIVLSVLLTGATVTPFYGLTGERLAIALAQTSKPSRYVADPYRLWSSNVRELYLPLDGVSVSIVPLWPAEVALGEVIPSQWWARGAAATVECVKTDLVNLWPMSIDVITQRGIYPPAIVSRCKWTNGSVRCGFLKIDGIETNGWEPPADAKGDVARVAMYVWCVYRTAMFDPWAGLLFQPDDLTPYGIDVLLRWSREDPVDDAERRRNEIIAEAQGCGNPFVEYAGLEEFIWGEKSHEPFLDPDTDPEEPMPLRSTYRVNEPLIYLIHDEVSDNAVWQVDGKRVAKTVSPTSLGVGSHLFEFEEPSGRHGKVLISIVA